MKLKNVLAIGLLFFLFNCEKDDTPPKSFIVTFDSQGGTAVDPVTVTAPATTIANLPIPPTKTGFVFAGWFTEINGGGTPFTTSLLVNADITVYAFWQHVPYTVTFDSQGGTAVSPVIIQAPATTIGTLPAPPTKTGAKFGGWSTTAGGSTLFTADTPVTGDITVYAIWDWIAGTLPSSANWRSVAYGNGVFVAVANGSNQAATSQDGVTWVARTLPANITKLTSITYGNGIFVAVAEGTQAVTSPDGITWTERTLPGPFTWVAVTYGNGIFVAASASHPVATSPDGITWTKQTPPGSFRIWYAITYGNGVFTMLAYATSIAVTSPDGVNWTERTLPCIVATGDSGWNSVAYGNSTFVAVSTGGCTAGATSPDGITWTARTFPGNSYWKQVAYGNGTFVAMAANKNQVVTSADGINWTYKNLPGSSNWSSIAYGNGIFVMIATGSNQTATSP